MILPNGIDTRLYHKDLGIVHGLAHESGLPLPAGSLVMQQINALMGQDRGVTISRPLITLLEKLS